MRLQAGTRLGPYEIVSPIGAGGMGEVYRARDTRLDRSVALKVLPQQFAENDGLRQRFEREARAISALSHPNICTLFDVGREGGVEYLVMERLEGETLADRIAKGPLPQNQALSIAIEIASALDAAHRAGITHRDLKPGNVMLTRSGAKLLDFGLAQMQSGATADPQPDPSNHPTQRALTAEGVIVGTLQYMAPEQLGGDLVDARADLFAFGCILYEMLAGRRAFSGSNRASLISSILTADPPPLPPELIDNGWRTDALVRKCLAKDRQDRWQNAGDLVTELRWIEQGETGDTRASVTRRPRHLWIAGVAGAAVAAAAIIATMSLHRKSEPPTMRFSIPAPANSHFNGVFASPIVLSPDGQQVAFVVNSGGRLFLYVRTLSTSAAVQLPGTEGARSLFWSPDSKFSVLCRRYSQAHHPCRHRAAGNHEGFARHLLLRRVVGERHDRSF